MRHGVVVVVLFLAAGMLAGCTDSVAKPKATEATEPSKTGPAGNETATRPVIENKPQKPATRHDWFYLRGWASPGAALTGASWKIPANSTVAVFEGSDWRRMYLEVAPVVGKDVKIDEWALYIFTKEDGGAQPMGLILSTQFQATERLAVLTSDLTVKASTDPFFFSTGSDEKDISGTTWYFVLAAESATPGPFDLAFRVLEERPRGSAANDSKAFIDARKGRAAVDVPVTGQGMGHHAAIYADINEALATGAPGILGVEAWTRDIKVTDRLPVDTRPMVTVRDVLVQSDFKTPSGWSAAAALYWGDLGAADWSVSMDLHGQAVQDSGVGVFTGIVGLIPFAGAIAQGEGGATVDFDVRIANYNQFEIFVVEHYGIGAPLETLIGIGPITGGSGTSAPTRPTLDGDALTWTTSYGADVHLLGAGALLGQE